MVRPVKISHIGIAVTDLEKAISDFGRIFDFDRVERSDVGSESVRVAMLKVGESEIELLSPEDDRGAIAKFLKEHGEGIHHVAITVPDLAEAMKRAKENGLNVIDSEPRKGARGSRAAFVHPKSLHGVLLELYDQ